MGAAPRLAAIAGLALAAACSDPSAAQPPKPAAPWTMHTVQGPPIGELRRARLENVRILREPVRVERNAYSDLFTSDDPAAKLADPSAWWLGPSELLVILHGSGEWWESTAVWLHLRVEDGAVRPLSLSVRWNADVLPLEAWCALGGELAIDDASLPGDWLLRGRFALDLAFVNEGRRGRSRAAGTGLSRGPHHGNLRRDSG